MVQSNHRRSRKKLASSTRMLCIYLDYKRLGHKCPCRSQGGALYGVIRHAALSRMVRGGAVKGSHQWLSVRERLCVPETDDRELRTMLPSSSLLTEAMIGRLHLCVPRDACCPATFRSIGRTLSLPLRAAPPPEGSACAALLTSLLPPLGCAPRSARPLASLAGSQRGAHLRQRITSIDVLLLSD
jgi:hypothetical protein